MREVNPPPSVEPLRWVLLTSHAVTTFEEAWEAITYYEQRPLIEKFHKSLKTGCRLEDRLYETAQRREAVTALLSIVAVRLLQLKTVAKAQPDRPSEELVPRQWIEMLSAMRKGKHKRIHTASEFLRALAGFDDAAVCEHGRQLQTAMEVLHVPAAAAAHDMTRRFGR